MRIIPSLESLEPCILQGKEKLLLKMNYYIERQAIESQVVTTIEPLEGWILEVDAARGTIDHTFSLQISAIETGIDQQLLGSDRARIVTIRWQDSPLGGEIYCYDKEGKVTGKIYKQIPEGDASLLSYSLGDDGLVYLFVQLPSCLRMYGWRLPSPY